MTTSATLKADVPPVPSPPRVASVDIARGLVMVLMAIDHARVYSGLPAGGPTAGIFFTRWITHFCAPAFVFLAGTSAFLYGRRHADLPRFLLLRGAWLVLLELTVVRVAWTFNFDFAHYALAGVIWAIGWSMILLALLVRLPVGAVTAIGVAVIAGHNLLDGYVAELIPTLGNDLSAAVWKILHVGFWAGPISAGPDGPTLVVLYSIVPWIGVMAAGYGFGKVLWLFTNHPMGNPEPPDGYTWSQGTMYLVWLVAVVLLYFACRWFARRKQSADAWWLRYL